MERNKDIGVNKSRALKRTNKNKFRKKNRNSINLGNIIPEIVDYLKSDSYFYSHFISSSTPSDSSAPHHVFRSSTGLDTGKPVVAIKDRVKEKLEDYLKSDTYLYAPLEGSQQSDNVAAKTIISPPTGQELPFMTVSSTVFSRKIAWQTKKVAENSVVERHGDHGSKGTLHDANVLSPETPGHQELNKQAARRSSRLSG